MSSLAETNRLISSLATMVMTDKVEAKDPFWNNSAKNLLEGLIGLFLEEYKLGIKGITFYSKNLTHIGENELKSISSVNGVKSIMPISLITGSSKMKNIERVWSR